MTKISAQQRLDMIERGLNPLREDHVNNYLSGKGNLSLKEREERARHLIGNDGSGRPLVSGRSLGHGNEQDRDPITGDYDERAYERPTQMDERSLRQTINEGMDDYASSTNGLTDLNPRRQQAPQQNSFSSNGNKLATAYYNAFIASLQNPSTNANMLVYKNLRAMLEAEKALLNTNGHSSFAAAVRAVTTQMYQQLKN